jgi:hypothetical protein
MFGLHNDGDHGISVNGATCRSGVGQLMLDLMAPVVVSKVQSIAGHAHSYDSDTTFANLVAWRALFSLAFL